MNPFRFIENIVIRFLWLAIVLPMFIQALVSCSPATTEKQEPYFKGYYLKMITSNENYVNVMFVDYEGLLHEQQVHKSNVQISLTKDNYSKIYFPFRKVKGNRNIDFFEQEVNRYESDYTVKIELTQADYNAYIQTVKQDTDAN